MVDVAGSEGRDAIEDFDTIQHELRAFSERLAELPVLVAGNKCDLATDEQQQAFADEMRRRGYEYFPMMAAIAHGTDALIKACAAKLATLPPIKEYEPEAAALPAADALKKRDVTVTKHDGVFFVEGEWLLTILRGIRTDDYESLQYFERVLNATGVIDALREAGVAEGDTVSIYNYEFEFIN